MDNRSALSKILEESSYHLCLLRRSNLFAIVYKRRPLLEFRRLYFRAINKYLYYIKIRRRYELSNEYIVDSLKDLFVYLLTKGDKNINNKFDYQEDIKDAKKLVNFLKVNKPKEAIIVHTDEYKDIINKIKIFEWKKKDTTKCNRLMVHSLEWDYFHDFGYINNDITFLKTYKKIIHRKDDGYVISHSERLLEMKDTVEKMVSRMKMKEKEEEYESGSVKS